MFQKDNIFYWFGLLFVLAITSGRAQEQFLYSKSLKENRAIQIYLPDDYGNSSKSYPVLYVLDGEYVFDYAKGAVDFLSNDFGFLPQMIVVGIPNTDRNRDLFVTLEPDGAYLNFIQFLNQDVIPYIEEHYRTNPFSLLYGWSSGSGVVNYIFVKTPQLFDAYILSGAGIGPKTEAFIKSELKPNVYEGIHLYASAEGPSFRAPALKKHEELIRLKKLEGLHKQFRVYDQLNHSEVLSQGLYDGLKFVFHDFYISDSISSAGSHATISYYKSLKKKYGFITEIPVGTINEICAKLVEENKSKEAVQLVDHGIRTHPHSATLLATKGEVHQYLKQFKLAADYYKKALQKAKDTIAKNKYNILYKNATSNKNN